MHVDVLCNKLRVFAYKMFSLKSMLPFHVLRIVYNALVESILFYGLTAWGRASRNILNKVETILRSNIEKHDTCES